MSRYLELKSQLALLELRIEIAQATEKPKVIEEIRARMAEWGIELRDLQDARKSPKYVPKKSGRYLPKYRDPDSGSTWSGKGREPGWIAGKDRSAFSLTMPEADAPETPD